MRCLVTGGTGFLGSVLVRRLRERGHDVTVASRSRGQDVTRVPTLEPSFREVQVVFHLAALVQSRPGPFLRVNVDGLRNVLELARRHRVARLVHVSSFTVFGPSGDGVHTEEHIPDRNAFFHGYDRSKYEAFRLADRWKDRLPMNTVFPTVVYGPGPMTEGNLLVRLLRRWKKLRMAALPGRGAPCWNFVYVDDVAEALIRCLDADPGEDFVLGGENRTLRDLWATYRRVAKVPIVPLGLPDGLFRAGARLEDWSARLRGTSPLLVPSTAEFFLRNWRFSSDKARAHLGYSPRSLEEGLISTNRWMAS